MGSRYGEVREVTDVQVGEEMEAPATEIANQEEGWCEGMTSLALACCI